jgi:hypothetical protein
MAGTPGSPVPGPLVAPVPPPPPAPEDSRLQKVIPQLRALFRYNDYTPLEQYRSDGPLGSAQRFSIAGQRWLEVTPDQLLGRGVRMRVRLLQGDQPMMTANIVAAPGAPALIGGPPHGDGVLIIILWANPNPGPRQ